MAEEKIRVLRLLEYIGPRDQVERTLTRSSVPLNGTAPIGATNIQIKSAMLGPFPEVIQAEAGQIYWFDGERVQWSDQGARDIVWSLFTIDITKVWTLETLLSVLVMNKKSNLQIGQVLQILKNLLTEGYIDTEYYAVTTFYKVHIETGEATGDAPTSTGT
jgi:hypothetical protein